MTKYGRTGFTLIELMVVVAIVGLLAAIAIPNFISYQLRSKTAEARTNIGGIKTSQEAFRATDDNYANIAMTNPSNVPGTTKTTWEESMCGASCNRTAPTNCTDFNCVGFRPAGAVYYVYDSQSRIGALPASPPEYCIGAQADLDGDGSRGQFEYGSANTVGSVLAPFTSCAPTCAVVSPGAVHDCAAGVY